MVDTPLRMSMLSTPARLMVRPFRVYAEIAGAAEGEGRPSALLGGLRFLFVFGAFVSFTATGRMTPAELVSGMLSFAYAPIIHAMAFGLAARAVAPHVPPARAFALYAEGYGPWFTFLLLVAGGSLFAPSPARLLGAVGGWMLLGTILWSVVLTFACFRSGLAVSRARATAGTSLHYLVITVIVLGYYVGAGQLLPILQE
jgi:hypothetical protein